MNLFGQKQKYYCKYCGMEYSDVRSLASNRCPKHPMGKGMYNHELYEGSVKAQYTCKYCGLSYRDLRALTSNLCQKHPGGRGNYHEPAL